mgnify:CR=1 FL=1
MVHPRMRGEHDSLEYSSRVEMRFIPACAGNTASGRFPHISSAVHPRMRGEHHFGHRVHTDRYGSSPHARGTRRPQSCLLRGGRFIPACAGNTLHPVLLLLILSVHPRMRGEHRNTSPTHAAASGSSPHARGTPGGNWHFRGAHRFIPACAGNTCCRYRTATSAAVHPRMRGEHLIFVAESDDFGGSSPHARGTPFSLPFSLPFSRFIPACAGNTL